MSFYCPAKLLFSQELIKKLKFSYNPENFSNPVLQTHLKNIEALALQLEVENEEGGVKVEDFTEPKTAAMEKRAGKLMAELVDLVYPSNYDPLAGVAKKRAYEPKEKKAPVKKGPAASGDGAGDADITAAAESGTLKKLTVAILKAVSCAQFSSVCCLSNLPMFCSTVRSTRSSQKERRKTT